MQKVTCSSTGAILVVLFLSYNEVDCMLQCYLVANHHLQK